MFYYFLGRYLANRKDSQRKKIQSLCRENYVGDNHLIVLFLIHHTSEDDVIDEVLVDCLDILSEVGEATLEEGQTERFSDIVAAIPESILTDESVQAERRKQRQLRDFGERQKDGSHDELPQDVDERFKQVYRMFRSIEILGQVLKNKYGVLPKSKVEDVVETIIDGGLRLVNLVMTDEDRIGEAAGYLRERYPDITEENVRKLLSGLLFLWTLANLDMVAKAVSVPPILEAVDVVVTRKGTPAYELVGFASLMQCAEKLTTKHVSEVKRLRKDSKDLFFKLAVSLIAQVYMNTHTSASTVEQAMCAALGIRYVYRKKGEE